MVELEVRSNADATETPSLATEGASESAMPSLAGSIAKLRNEEKTMVKIDIKKVEELCSDVSDAATYKRIALLPSIQARFDLAFQILEEFQKGSKHFEQLLGIIGKTESDCEADYFSIMLKATQGAK